MPSLTNAYLTMVLLYEYVFWFLYFSRLGSWALASLWYLFWVGSHRFLLFRFLNRRSQFLVSRNWLWRTIRPRLPLPWIDLDLYAWLQLQSSKKNTIPSSKSLSISVIHTLRPKVYLWLYSSVILAWHHIRIWLTLPSRVRCWVLSCLRIPVLVKIMRTCCVQCPIRSL